MEKPSKELQGIINAIEKWMKKHDNNVSFVCDFVAFKGKDFDVVDDRMLAFGPKETLTISLDELTKDIKKEKDDFVNW